MRTLTRTGAPCWLLALTAALWAAPALTAQAPAQSTPPSTTARASTPADTAAVPVLLYEEDVVAWTGEPDEHLVRARAALAAHDAPRAAAEITSAAAFVRVEAATAQGVDHADLAEAGRDLDRTAGEIRRGKIRTARELDHALRRTDAALARHHLARAQRAWDHKEVAKAGHALRGAARYTERLAHDGGHDVERGSTVAIHDARRVGGAMIDGAGWTAGEVGKGFGALKRAIDRLGDHVAPAS
jgi:hypothetical protein